MIPPPRATMFSHVQVDVQPCKGLLDKGLGWGLNM